MNDSMGNLSPTAAERRRHVLAADLLRTLMAAGPVAASQVRVEAEAAGHGWRTMQRASLQIGVIRRKHSMKHGWLWALPAAAAEGAKIADAFGNEGSDHSPDHAPGCLAAYGFEVPFDGLMHGVPHRD